MIKNNRQMTVSNRQRKKFLAAIGALEAEVSTDPFAVAHLAMLRADLAKIEREIEDYKAAVAGEFDPAKIAGIDSIASDLVKARIAAGLTQEALARLAHCKSQQVQRYEKTEYAGASLSTLQAFSSVLLSALKFAKSR
jgi:DNA-binding transcriptional regulator YiaG